MTYNLLGLRSKLDAALGCFQGDCQYSDLAILIEKIERSEIDFNVYLGMIDRMILYGGLDKEQKVICEQIKDCITVEMWLYANIKINLSLNNKINVIKFYEILVIDGDHNGKILKRDCVNEQLMRKRLSENFAEIINWHYNFFCLIIASYKEYMKFTDDVLNYVLEFCKKYKNNNGDEIFTNAHNIQPKKNSSCVDVTDNKTDLNKRVERAIIAIDKLVEIDYSDSKYDPLRMLYANIKDEFFDLKGQLVALNNAYQEQKKDGKDIISDEMLSLGKKIEITLQQFHEIYNKVNALI